MLSLFLKNRLNKTVPLGLFFTLIFTASLFLPLFFGKVFFDGDTITYDYPVFSFYKNTLDRGGDVSLNPYYLAGFPSVLSPVGSYIDPLNRFLLAVSPDFITAYHARFFISVLMALFFSYLFGRKVGLGTFASLILAFLYLLGQTFNNLTSGLINSGSVFLLPALLLSIQILHESKTKKSFIGGLALGGGCLLFGLLSGFIQTVFYSLLFATSYALFLGWQRRGVIVHIGRWRALLGYAFFSVLALLPAYLLMQETFDFRPHTLRVHGFGSFDVTGLSLADFFYFFIPDHISIPLVSTEQALGLFIGIPALFFALFSVLYLRKENRLVSFSSWAYGIAVLSLITPLGIAWLLGNIPVFSWFHSIKRLLLPAVFFLAFLAAYGFEKVCNDKHLLKEKKYLVRSFLGISFLPFFFFAIVNLARVLFPLTDASKLQLVAQKIYLFTGGSVEQFYAEKDHYVLVFTNALQTLYHTFSASNWSLFLLFLLPPVFMFSIRWYKNGRISQQAFSLGVFSLLLGTVWLSFAGLFGSYISRDVFLKRPALADVLVKDAIGISGQYTMSFLTGEGVFRNLADKDLLPDERFSALSELVRPNINSMYHVKRFDGYEPYQTARSAHLLNDVIVAERIDRKAGVSFEISLLDKEKDFLEKLPLLSSYSVRFIITPYELFDEGLVLATTTKVARTLPLFIYENKNVLPLAFVPQIVHTESPWEDDFFNRIGRAHQTESVIECQSCSRETGFYTGSRETGFYTGRATILEETNTRVRISVLAEGRGSWVLLNQSFLPGWQAFVDGKKVEIVPANYIMQAVFVPPGEHELIFQYQ